MGTESASLFDLSGKVALVTGGSRGLGRSMASALASAGAQVVVVSRKQDACDRAADEITEESGVPALGRACHVARWDDVDRLVEEVYGELGKVDVLINNAGMSPTYDGLLEITEKMWASVLGVNLLGPFRLSTLVGTRMAARGSGSIVNISTVGAVQPDPAYLPYATAKAGLNAMTRALAKGLAPHVRVNCVMPGPFRTDILAGLSDDQVDDLAASLPLGRIGDPMDMAGAILWLASQASSFVTGQVFAVDGGQSM